MKKFQILALSAIAAIGTMAVSCQGGAGTPNANLKTEVDTLSYAYGVQLSESGNGNYATNQSDEKFAFGIEKSGI